ncbi:MAG: PAS domain S-box protein [Verrucomicrobiota bacterium]
MTKTYPLNYAIPVVLFTTSASLVCVLILGDILEASRQLEQVSQRELAGLAADAVGAITCGCTNGIPESLARSLALNQGTNVLAGLIFDGSNRVLAGREPLPVTGSDAPADTNLLNRARSRRSPQFEVARHGSVLAGAFPFTPAPAAGTTPPSSIGILYLELDLSPLRNQQLETNFQRAGVVGILVFVWCFLIWTYLDHALTQRIARLIAATRHMASEDPAEALPLPGKDELAQLGRTLHQIAVQRQARAKALADSEEKYRQIVETADEGIFTVEAELQLSFINRRLAGLLGYTIDGIIDHPLEEFVAPEDWPDLQNNMMRQQLCGTSRHECRFRRKNGEVVWVRVSSTVLHDAAGGFAGAVGMVTDLSDHKRDQQRLLLQSSALLSCANAIVITDPAGRIEWVNPAFTRLTGYAEAEAVGQMVKLLKSGRHPPEFYRRLWRTILDGKTWEGEITNHRRDGRLYTEHMTIAPVLDEQKRIAHYVAIKEKVADRSVPTHREMSQ